MSKKRKKGISSTPSPATTHFPTPLVMRKNLLSDEEKIQKIAHYFQKIMEVLDLDLGDDSLSNTPYRVAKMYVQEVFAGLREENFPEIRFFKDEFQYEQISHMVFVKVGFTSFCEHHFVPMKGCAYVAYIPGDKVIGVSKIPRIVRYFASRPQLQERLTAQIADSLAILLEIDDVAVSVNAQHHCVMARGVQDENSHMITNVLRGQFNTEDHLRREFFEGINRDM